MIEYIIFYVLMVISGFVDKGEWQRSQRAWGFVILKNSEVVGGEVQATLHKGNIKTVTLYKDGMTGVYKCSDLRAFGFYKGSVYEATNNGFKEIQRR